MISLKSRGIVGATPLGVPRWKQDIKGRALMKRDEVDIVQFALPVAGDNDIQIINNLRDQVQASKEMCGQATLAGIPMVPDELTEAAFYGLRMCLCWRKIEIPVGLNMETAEGNGMGECKRGHLAGLARKNDVTWFCS